MIKSAPPFGDIKHDGASRGDANRGSAAAGESKLAFFAGDELNRCVYPIEFFLFFFADVVKKSFPKKNFFFFFFFFVVVVVVVFVVLGALKMLPMRPAKSVFLLDDGGVLNAGHSFVVSASFFLVFLFPSSASFVPSSPVLVVVVEGASSVDIIVASSPAFAFRFIDEKRAFMCRPFLSSHQAKETTTTTAKKKEAKDGRSTLARRSRVRENSSQSALLLARAIDHFLNFFSFLFWGWCLGFCGVSLKKGVKRSLLSSTTTWTTAPPRRPRRHHVRKMRSN